MAAVLLGAGAWLLAAQHRGGVPADLAAEPRSRKWPLTADGGAAVRDDALRRAAVRLAPAGPFALPDRAPHVDAADPLTCRYLNDEPSGTTPKFDCVLASGEVVKVKYGRNAEVHAEILASRLLRGLGYAADEVTIARRVRCHGCPRYPFFTTRMLTLLRADGLLDPHGYEGGYTDFEWASVERKFPAATIETDTVEGWGWWELERSEAPRADVDALRLLAVFVAHWDNKSGNQRLVCLDPAPTAADRPCGQPVALIQDLGSTFGPSKLNLVRWGGLPMWTDSAACTVSMRGFPFLGGTFPDATIGEAGRLQLLNQLESIDNADLERLFVDARGPQYLSGTDDRADVDLWTTAFAGRVQQIRAAGPCPSLEPDGAGVD